MRDDRRVGRGRAQACEQRLGSERLGTLGQRARVDEHVLRLGASCDRIRLMQPLAARIGLGDAARVTREVVGRVVDAAKLELLQRSRPRSSAVQGSAAKGGNCSSSTGPPVSASPEISRLSAFAQSNGSMDKRPLKTHVNAKMPKNDAGDVVPAHPALIANGRSTSETASTC